MCLQCGRHCGKCPRKTSVTKSLGFEGQGEELTAISQGDKCSVCVEPLHGLRARNDLFRTGRFRKGLMEQLVSELDPGGELELRIVAESSLETVTRGFGLKLIYKALNECFQMKVVQLKHSGII